MWEIHFSFNSCGKTGIVPILCHTPECSLNPFLPKVSLGGFGVFLFPKTPLSRCSLKIVGTLPNGYMRSAPLPRIPHTRPNRVPNGQSTSVVRPSVRTYKPAAVWPMNNRTAMLANIILGHMSNRLIID
jgi:hypothetical protein